MNSYKVTLFRNITNADGALIKVRTIEAEKTSNTAAKSFATREAKKAKEEGVEMVVLSKVTKGITTWQCLKYVKFFGDLMTSTSWQDREPDVEGQTLLFKELGAA